MKHKYLYSTFIYLLLSCTLILSKLKNKSSGDIKMLNKVNEQVKDLKSNMKDFNEEEEKRSENLSMNSSDDYSSGLINEVKALNDQFAEYKKSLLKEDSSMNKSLTESIGYKSEIESNLSHSYNYLDEIKKVTNDITHTVAALVKVEKNDKMKEKVGEKLHKIQVIKQKFREANGKIKYLNTLKENNSLLKNNADKAKTVMGNLISLYNEYISIEENLNNNLNTNLSDINEDFKKSYNLLSNIDFFSVMLEKIENFYSMLEESSLLKEDKEKEEKFKKFIEQINKLDMLNKNLNMKIETEIEKVKKVSNQNDRLLTMNRLLKISNVLKSLNVKVLGLKDDVCKKMKVSLESNLDMVTEIIKNPHQTKSNSELLNRSLYKITEKHKKAVENYKSIILSHLNELQDLIKSNINFSENSLKEEKSGLGKIVFEKFSVIDQNLKELKTLNKSYDEKQKIKIDKLLINARNTLNQLKELAGNSKNILNILEKNNNNQKVIKEDYRNLVDKIQNFGSNIKSNVIIDQKSIDEMNAQLKSYAGIFEYLKTKEVRTSIKRRFLNKLVKTNEDLLQKINVSKLIDEIAELEKLKK